jgi:mono/diheme cytochrome c family protein
MRLSTTSGRLGCVARRILLRFGGPGFSPAKPDRRLQPLKLRLDAALPWVLPLVLGICTLLVSSPLSRAQQSPTVTPTAGNVQNGKKNFTADGCYECHGLQGQGATQTGGARIGPPILSLESFMSYVRHPANQMPPYTSKAISDQDLTDIYAYLKSIPLPPKGKDIPLLNK